MYYKVAVINVFLRSQPLCFQPPHICLYTVMFPKDFIASLNVKVFPKMSKSPVRL
jgi:hypothetical protein